MRITLLLLMALATCASLNAQNTRIHPEVREGFLLATTQDVLIVMDQQQVVQPAIASSLTKAEKGQLVFAELTALANRTQASVRNYLSNQAVVYRSFHIVNAVQAQLSEQQARHVVGLPGVAEIIPNPWVKQDLGFIERQHGQMRSAIEWGVTKINAPVLWDLGFRGEGVVVGGQDTGYDFRHPAIVNQYRGSVENDTIHDYNWHDAIRVISPLNSNNENPCGLDVTEPCDDNNHGTHTMGTMIGDDGLGNQIGVAPAARWIACRNMERGWGSPASYIECFQWFLAPTKVDGTEPDPSKAPHVIANSWSCPEQEGCVPENFDLMRTAIENLRAAGVMVVTSAGNSGGQGCASVTTPPSIFAAAFAVGATNSEDTIAGFSSRGPATLSGDTILQPQVVAPGVNVRSSIRNGGYANFSGTSMSGPHTAGAVALLISAVPELAGNVAGLERIFRESAMPLFSSQDCGDYPGNQHPNAVYGYGRIDLAAAYELAQTLVNTHETEAAAAIKLFPNPTRGEVFISVPVGLEMRSFEVLDFTGARLVSGSHARPNLSLLPAGIYLLRVNTNAGTVIRKVIRQ